MIRVGPQHHRKKNKGYFTEIHFEVVRIATVLEFHFWHFGLVDIGRRLEEQLVTKLNIVMSITRCSPLSVVSTIPFVNRITYVRTDNCSQKFQCIYCPYSELQLCDHCNNSRPVRIVT